MSEFAASGKTPAGGLLSLGKLAATVTYPPALANLMDDKEAETDVRCALASHDRGIHYLVVHRMPDGVLECLVRTQPL